MQKPAMRDDRDQAAQRINPDTITIGPHLRAARERAKLTVRELARRTGLSASLISQVENGKVLPSLATLFRLTNELDAPLNAAVFGESSRGSQGGGAAGGSERIVRSGTGERIKLQTGVEWERLTGTTDAKADFLKVTYPAGASSCEAGQQMRHNGREYGYVLSGVLRVTIGFEEHQLGPGDAIAFDSTLPHRLETIGDEPAEAIWLVTGRNEPV